MTEQEVSQILATVSIRGPSLLPSFGPGPWGSSLSNLTDKMDPTSRHVWDHWLQMNPQNGPQQQQNQMQAQFHGQFDFQVPSNSELPPPAAATAAATTGPNSST